METHLLYHYHKQNLLTDLLHGWLDFKVGFIGVNEDPLNFDIFPFVFHVELKLWIGKQLLESVLVSCKEFVGQAPY